MISFNNVVLFDNGNAAAHINLHAKPGDLVLVEREGDERAFLERLGRSGLQISHWTSPETERYYEVIENTKNLVNYFFACVSPFMIRDFDVENFVEKVLCLPPDLFPSDRTNKARFILEAESSICNNLFLRAMRNQNEELKNVLLTSRSHQTFVVVQPSHLQENIFGCGNSLAKDLKQFFSDRDIPVFIT